MQNNQVTIIIPNYNGIHYLNECLNSIYQDQSIEITHVIVVDNGSADASVDFIKTNYPKIELIELSENTGFCHAVNVGIKRAATEYVILLNNDTIIRRGFTSHLLKTIKQDDRIFSVAAKMLDMKNDNLIDNAGDFYNALGWAFARGKGKQAARFGKPTPIFSACAGAAIYRRQIIIDLGYFDEAHFAYLEDIDIGYAARLNGYKNLFCPSAEVLHYGSAASGSRYNEWKTDLASRNSIYIIRKNMPPVQILFNLPFLLVGFLTKFIFFSKKGMGKRYLMGLFKGLRMPLRDRKVRYKKQNFRYYLSVQMELYINIVRMF